MFLRLTLSALVLAAQLLFTPACFGQALVVYVGSSPIVQLEPRRARIVGELGKLGLVESKDFTLLVRSYDNDPKKLAELAEQIVRLKPAIVYAAAFDAAKALGIVTKTVPIVFAARANLESPSFRIVENLNEPEANLTGFTRYVNTVPKRLQVLRDAFPAIRSIGFVYGVSMRPEREAEYRDAARKLGLALNFRKFETSELPSLASRLNRGEDDAYLVALDDLWFYHREAYFAQLLALSKPVIHAEEGAQRGVLMHYVPVLDGEAKAAEYISKLLRGAKVRDLAVQEPQEFDFSVNVTTLRRLGLTMSRDVLARARKVE